MIQYFMKQYLFLLWGITSLIFSSLFLACSDDEPGDKTPVFTIKRSIYNRISIKNNHRL